jgi:hypothetical protein
MNADRSTHRAKLRSPAQARGILTRAWSDPCASVFIRGRLLVALVVAGMACGDSDGPQSPIAALEPFLGSGRFQFIATSDGCTVRGTIVTDEEGRSSGEFVLTNANGDLIASDAPEPLTISGAGERLIITFTGSGAALAQRISGSYMAGPARVEGTDFRCEGAPGVVSVIPWRFE